MFNLVAWNIKFIILAAELTMYLMMITFSFWLGSYFCVLWGYPVWTVFPKTLSLIWIWSMCKTDQTGLVDNHMDLCVFFFLQLKLVCKQTNKKTNAVGTCRWKLMPGELWFTLQMHPACLKRVDSLSCHSKCHHFFIGIKTSCFLKGA